MWVLRNKTNSQTNTQRKHFSSLFVCLHFRHLSLSSFLVPSLLAFAIMLHSLPLVRQWWCRRVGLVHSACSFCLSLFLTPFNCFSVGPPWPKSPRGLYLSSLDSSMGCSPFRGVPPLPRFVCPHTSPVFPFMPTPLSPPVTPFVHCFLSPASPLCDSFVPPHIPPPVSPLVPPDMFYFVFPPLLWCLLSLVATDPS